MRPRRARGPHASTRPGAAPRDHRPDRRTPPSRRWPTSRLGRDGLLFVGLNPSPGERGSRPLPPGPASDATFWRRVHHRWDPAVRAPPLESADDALVAAGHGITDLHQGPTARDEAPDAELTAGVGPLWQKIALWRPAAVVFIYKRAASIAAGRHARGAVGPAPRGRARGPAVLPDAGTVRAGRIGRRGPEPPAQPRGVAARGPGLASVGGIAPAMPCGRRPRRLGGAARRPSASSATAPVQPARGRPRTKAADRGEPSQGREPARRPRYASQVWLRRRPGPRAAAPGRGDADRGPR